MRQFRRRPLLVASSILGGALALLASPREARAETDITPGLLTNSTWVATGNPYVLTGDITVPVGVSLTIDSGVIVEIADGDTTNGGDNTDSVDITIKGALTINGSPTFPVVFQPAPGNDSWVGLALETGSNTEITSLELDDPSTGIGMQGDTLNINDITIKNAGFGIIVASGQTFVDRAIITGRTVLGNATASGFSTLAAADGTTLDVGNSVASGFHYGGYFEGAGITATLTNVTLVTDTGGNYPLSVRSGATVIMSDSILAAPADFGCAIEAVATPIINLTTSDTFPADSCTGFTAGAGVITVDPKFVSSTDFHLSASSPCIDTAASSSANTHDVEGSVRPVDGNGDGKAQVDMGAYEFQGKATSSDGGASGDGGSASSKDGGSAGSDGGSGASSGGDAGTNGNDDGGGCSASGSTDPSALSFFGIGIALFSMARRRKRRR